MSKRTRSRMSVAGVLAACALIAIGVTPVGAKSAARKDSRRTWSRIGPLRRTSPRGRSPVLDRSAKYSGPDRPAAVARSGTNPAVAPARTRRPPS